MRQTTHGIFNGLNEFLKESSDHPHQPVSTLQKIDELGGKFARLKSKLCSR